MLIATVSGKFRRSISLALAGRRFQGMRIREVQTTGYQLICVAISLAKRYSRQYVPQRDLVAHRLDGRCVAREVPSQGLLALLAAQRRVTC